MLGSKFVRDVQSSRLDDLGCWCKVSGEITVEEGEALKTEFSGEKCLGAETAESGCCDLGVMVKVKLDCLSMTFSD